MAKRRKRTTDPFRTETKFLIAVIELAELCGWYLYHVTNVQNRLRSSTSVGFPDLVLVRRDRVLFRELKVGKRKLTIEQEEWRDRLQEAGADFAVWHPTMWDAIIEDLK